MDGLVKELERQERSARWLARKTGVDPSLVHRYLSGERRTPDDFKHKAAAVLGVDVATLFGETLPA